LEVTRHGTIWIEPEFVVRSTRTEYNPAFMSK
jgi:hypothetical protein